jgi:TolA-binding protein
MNGERWESSLLYSQVDKDFKEGVLGEKARYQNAKLSYYAGDFEWAQEQFKILKGATSKLISNDAIDMSVFILDNLGLDTTEATLQMFASADLLIFQNKFDEALQKLDSINILFPEHSLEDDVLYQKAQIFKKLRNIDKVVPLFEKITETFKEEIKADNALFELAEIYETVLNDKEKAKMLYEKLFIEYSGSTFAVEARKRFRILRGDEI